MKAQEDDPKDVAITLGGRALLKSGADYDVLQRHLDEGWIFRKTKLTDEFDFDTYKASLPEGTEPLFALQPNGVLSFASVNSGGSPRTGDTVVAFTVPTARGA